MIFLLLNLALGFYNVGTIWAHEVDIFRSWQYVGADFHRVQQVHWAKLPYWVLAPVALAFAGSLALIWYHPAGSPIWALAGVFGCQFASVILTALTWGPWQAALSRDPLGSRSPYLRRILRTHWLRTALITASGFLLLAWVIVLVSTNTPL
ncbi:MAG: hypothetical protein JO190_00600 [Candidatus Eremiobacteraeota bacterium]|nr:hypothetical protein [Candidatus Eremiobacteraeota bacterium]